MRSVLPVTLLTAAAIRVPVDTDRDAARDAARRELSEPAYHQHDPGLLQRAISWVLDRLAELLAAVGGGSTALGFLGLVVAAVLLVLVIVATRLRLGPFTRIRTSEALFGGGELTASEHRAAARDFADQGRWAEAIRERLRAVIRDLERRGLLDARPGRTADEAAAEAGAALPQHHAGLASAARIFDEVWYGGRTATPDGYERLRVLDEAIQATRPRPAGGGR